MFKFILSLFFFVLAFPLTVFAGNNGVCQKCIIIREENAKKHNPYDYYEDYLKAKENGQLEDEEMGSCQYMPE